MKSNNILAHILAIITILIWGTTYISTKILLTKLTPQEILIFRFFLAFMILIVIYPKKIKILPLKEEILFCFLGLTGVSLYYFAENLALKYTYASNVGLIASSIPIFTSIIVHFVYKNEKFSIKLVIGFITAMTGISIVIYNGKILKLNPAGDFIAILSAILFSIYSILIKKVSKEYSQLFVVRKVFFYGIVTMLPIAAVSKVRLYIILALDKKVILNLLFLSIFASILCFIMWNKAIGIIGSIKTTNYIYLVPLITMITSIIILNEKVNGLMIFGGCLILLGVYINQSDCTNKVFNLLQNCNKIVQNKNKNSF